MKIGILTFHRSANSGSLLQAYALKAYIEKSGHDAIIANIKYKYTSKYKHFLSRRLRAMLGRMGERLWWVTEMRTYFHHFFANIKASWFRIAHLGIRPFTGISKQNAGKLNARFDLFIAGSDQIWNPDNMRFDFTFMLDFVSDNQKKMSYGPSAGDGTIPEEYETKYIELLRQMRAVSFRERTTARRFYEHYGIACTDVMDPTFLLSRQDWEGFAGKKTAGGDYIFLYLRHTSKEQANEIMDFTLRLSQKTGCRILRTRHKVQSGNKNRYVHEVYPKSFLRLIWGAKYVITNSFHGTALSVNLNKDFYTQYIEGNKANTRIQDFLEVLGLKDRVLSLCDPDDPQPIDYNAVNGILEKQRNKSKEYLESNISATAAAAMQEVNR